MSGYWSTWYEMVCPSCNKHQFIDGGDTNDLTGSDPEGCKCFECGTCFNFDGDVIDEEEAMCDDGENLVKEKKNE